MILHTDLARLSLLAYEDDIPGGYIIQSGDAQCAVFDNVYAFRGTEASKGVWGDIAANGFCDLVKWPRLGMVCEGYWGQAWALITEMKASVKPGAVFTGHSMGGVLATLCGYYMEPSCVVAFGPPRSMDHTAARSCPVDVTNYIGRQDFWCKHPFGGVVKATNRPASYTRPGRVIEVDSDHFGYVEALSQG